jgi:SAM-dependent methyltransferase
VLDLGAGTGKLTRLLVSAFARVFAVEPDTQMRRRVVTFCPDAQVLDGSAEQIPVADASVAAAFAAQSFHTFDQSRAIAEIERVLRLARCESKCTNCCDAAEVERVFYPEMEKLLLAFYPGATDALVYNHDVFDKDYKGDRREDQANKNPGVNANYAYLVHNDLNDNSGRVRCRELLTKNLRNFGREQRYTEADADAKMLRRFLSINLAKPMETVGQNPFVLCAWPSFADQPYITNYRIYDDRVGETTRFTYRPSHEWYWFPQQTPNEVSMLKCYDSITDGSVSRWSFHSACVDPTAEQGLSGFSGAGCDVQVASALWVHV